MAINWGSLANAVGKDKADKARAKYKPPSGGSGGAKPPASTPAPTPKATPSKTPPPKTTPAPTYGSSSAVGGKYQSSFLNAFTAGAKGVGGGFGGGTGGAWGEAPKIEFSVLPGAKTGPIVTPPSFNTANTTPSSLSKQPSMSFDPTGAFLAAAKPIEAMGLNTPGGAAFGIGTAALGGPLIKAGLKGVKWAAGLAKGGKALNKADDLARMTKPPTLPRTTPRLPIRPPIIPTAMSRLGQLAKVGTGIAAGGIAATTATTFVRNALSPTATPPGQAGAAQGTSQGTSQGQAGATSGQTDGGTDTQTAGRQATASFAPQYASFGADTYSAPAGGGVSGVSGGGGGGSYGATGGSNTGNTGAYALRGEQLTEQQAAAQARAIELQRQQASGAGVNVPPIGDQVDLAGLQQLRDQAKQLYEQYGADAVTMPEYKAAIQGMVAAGIQNMRSIQQAPPEPVEETPEQTQYYDQLPPDQARDARAESDQIRRQYGQPDLVKQKMDLNIQINAVNQAYQEVIDMIKENPNLPKGLAARRLTEQFEDQKFALSSLMVQLDNVQEQIDEIDKIVDSNRQDAALQLQYDQFATSREDKEYQRRMDQLGMMVESRAVGGMTDQEIRQWSSVTGISEGALKKMRANALDSENEKEVSFEKNGDDLYMITYDKKNPLNRDVELIGTARSSGGAGGNLSKDQLGILNTISDNARQQPEIKNFPTLRESYESALNAKSQATGAGDIVLMRMIAKITDPTTGVREEEFRTFEAAQSTLSRYGVNLSKRWWKGDRLTPEGRNALFQVAQDRYSKAEQAYTQAIGFYQNQAQQFGIPSGTPIVPTITSFATANGEEFTDMDTQFMEDIGMGESNDQGGWLSTLGNYLKFWD